MYIRAFIAIEISQELQNCLDGLQRALEEPDDRVSWIQPGNIHLTLKFLGEIKENRIPCIAEAVRKTADDHPAYTLTLGALGVFPSRRVPRIIWVGVD
jgi:RNA 2',3'-cyclic 3'-phosphodiesterase